MAFNDLCNHNVLCGQEGLPGTTMESHEVLFLLLLSAIVLVVALLVFLSVASLLKRKKTDEPTLRALSEQFSTRQDSTRVELRRKRTRKKGGTKTTCTGTWKSADHPPCTGLHSVGATVVSAYLRVHQVLKCDTFDHCYIGIFVADG